jgi:iron complex outermembrane recepter protein
MNLRRRKLHYAIRKASAVLITAPILAVSSLPAMAQSQIEEVVVTAQRRETNLQETPMSVQAFGVEDLERVGIDTGSDLGIMVPNVVLNPGVGQGQASFYIRGLPGVGIYIDGIWQGAFGFQQTNFTEMAQVEVLRGPQGTLFGRNTNGGAINMTTKRPADEFGARVNLDVGNNNRRNATISLDVPIADTLKSKWTLASFQNDGYLDSVSVDRSYGGQDDFILRGDLLWEPLDNFSLRLTGNIEDKSSSDARVTRFTNLNHGRYLGLNVLAGNPEMLAAARAIDPSFPDPPKQLAANRFTPQTHQAGFPGGEVGKWQTKADQPGDGIKTDLDYFTLTSNWDITDNISFEALLSTWQLDRRQVVDFDGSEFFNTTDDLRYEDENTTFEFHLTGSNFDDRVNWLAGYYSLEEETKFRNYRWLQWEFANPNTGPGDPSTDIVARDYVRSYGDVVGNASLSTFFPLIFLNNDELTGSEDEDTAWFGEVTVSVTEKIDATVGVRISEKDGRAMTYTPSEAFRTDNPQVSPSGDSFAGALTGTVEDDDLGSITTNKFALTYQHNDDMMFYGSWAEGFTSGGFNNVANIGIVELKPEIVTTWELGLRSDWLDGRLRVNATYFDSEWEGMRVNQLPPDPNNPGQFLPTPYPTSDGLGEATGVELDITYIPADNWLFTLGLGLLDTKYNESGTFDGINGIAPNSSFAYASDESASVGVQYDYDLSSGNQLTFSLNYGWMGEYARDAAYQRTLIDANGDLVLEPAYGILNSRVMYQPNNSNWNVTLWGTNLTDEQYVNGGFDTRNVWGYDFSVVGRAREYGLSVNMEF